MEREGDQVVGEGLAAAERAADREGRRRERAPEAALHVGRRVLEGVEGLEETLEGGADGLRGGRARHES